MEKEADEAPEAKEKEDEVQVQVKISHSVWAVGFCVLGSIIDNVIKITICTTITTTHCSDLQGQ